MQGHTCSAKDASLPSLEFIQSPDAFGLCHLAMDGNGIEAQVPQHERHLACVVTGAREDHESRTC